MSERTLARKMIDLTENPDFVELIIEGFIKEGVLEYSLQHNLRSEAIVDELRARQILHEYIYGIITQGDKPKST